MHLLPRPLECEISDGHFFLDQTAKIVIDTSLGFNASYYGDLLSKDVERTLGFTLSKTREETGKTENGVSGIIFMPFALAKENEEAYEISVEENAIKLTGAGEAGLLYAVQSLRQLVRENGAFIPCLKICDAPAMKSRGYCYDTTRGRVPTIEFLKGIADRCSFYKLNQMQLNVEHSYLFKNESELWRSNTPLTAEDIMELDEYCKRLHIDLVPNLASFGHLYELLRSKSYSHLCELEIDENEPYSLINRMRHHTVNVSDDEAFELVTSRIKEYMDLFSSKYFNICADETFDLGRGKNKERAEKEGSKKLYIDFLKKLCTFLMECGKSPMYWGDIIVEKPEIIEELPRDSICLNWEYSPNVNEDNLRKFSETKAENIFVCPGVQSWNHMINNHDDAYENISKMCSNGFKYKAKGMLNTDWGDLGHIGHPEFSTVGLIYGAAFSWNKNIIPREEINESISIIQYGDKDGKIVDLFAELANQENINWWLFVMYKEFCEGKIEDKDLTFDIVMNEERALEVPKHNAAAKSLVNKLYLNLPAMSDSTKEVINAYILMAEGQMLLGEVGLTMQSILKDESSVSDAESALLASKLEKWFYRYTSLWRSVSKESELHRLGDVLAWYADRLRK